MERGDLTQVEVNSEDKPEQSKSTYQLMSLEREARGPGPHPTNRKGTGTKVGSKGSHCSMCSHFEATPTKGLLLAFIEKSRYHEDTKAWLPAGGARSSGRVEIQTPGLLVSPPPSPQASPSSTTPSLSVIGYRICDYPELCD
ncbi:hypothetical protein RRG08_040241 [Elysia crispata]|uniref:Uncharacterized protein n=1 Tax=Elysia crispata TaxID=231223 RepID=A0AAE0YI49_9GAST|nr:hypothetical protein RRG08_040241 [Elysia crispata]